MAQRPGQCTGTREEFADDGTAIEGDESATAAARLGRIARWREQTREQRIAIAEEAEPRYGRKIAWGAQIADEWLGSLRAALENVQRLREQGPGGEQTSAEGRGAEQEHGSADGPAGPGRVQSDGG